MGSEGQWKQGVRHGDGTLYNDDGRRCESEWKNNLPNGQGTLYDPEGNREYEGGFKDGEFHGQGTIFDDGGGVVFQGEFENSEFTWDGKVVYFPDPLNPVGTAALYENGIHILEKDVLRY